MNKIERLFLLNKINDPAFLLLNNLHTLMVRGGNEIRLLVFSKELKEEVFIPCQLDLDTKSLIKGDRTDTILANTLSEYKDSKRIHQGLGSRMSSI